MVKHQEVQLLLTHTFADKHLLKQCLNKDLTEYSYSPKKRNWMFVQKSLLKRKFPTSHPYDSYKR